MKILFVCTQGISTRVLTKKVCQKFSFDNIDIMINTCSYNRIDSLIDDYDVILLAPQAKIMYDPIFDLCQKKRKKFVMITESDYNEDALYKIIISMFTKNNKKDKEMINITANKKFHIILSYSVCILFALLVIVSFKENFLNTIQEYLYIIYIISFSYAATTLLQKNYTDSALILLFSCLYPFIYLYQTNYSYFTLAFYLTVPIVNSFVYFFTLHQINKITSIRAMSTYWPIIDKILPGLLILLSSLIFVIIFTTLTQ